MAGSAPRGPMGGSAGALVVRLAFASILVGALMSLLGFDPASLVRGIWRRIDEVFDLGWGAVIQVGRWLVYGAVIVVPVWLVMRLAGGHR